MLTSAVATLIQVHVLQFTIAICLVALVAFVTARRWPHFTFLLCMLALAKCLVPPIISSPAGLFTWNSAVALSSQELAAQDSDSMAAGLQPRPIEGSVMGVMNARGAKLADASDSAWILLPSAEWFTWVVGGLWLVGSALVLTRSIGRYRELMQQLRASSHAPPGLYRLVLQLKKTMGVRRHMNVIVSQRNMGPGYIGIRQPTLVIPQAMLDDLPEHLLRPIIAHELVHARRGDVLWGFLQFVAQIVWWFHPLVWLIGRRASILCERCVDEEVVARLQCKTGTYAESLVRVLQFKRLLKPVPFGHNLSAAEITSHRLQQLGRRTSRLNRGTSLPCWTLILTLTALCLPGMQWHADEHPTLNVPTLELHHETLMELIARQQWDTAETILREITAANRECPNTAFFLAYVVHAQGDIAEALTLHQRASMFPSVRPVALYNCGCACALLGRNEEALDYLDAALQAGFARRRDLLKDPDLASLASLPRFERLRKSYDAFPEPLPALEIDVDHWVTLWNDYNRGDSNALGRPIEANIEQVHLNRDSDENPPYKHCWKQITMSTGGSISELEINFSQDTLELVRDVQENSAHRTCRVTIVRLADGRLEQSIERSRPSRPGWETVFKGSYRSVKELSQATSMVGERRVGSVEKTGSAPAVNRSTGFVPKGPAVSTRSQTIRCL